MIAASPLSADEYALRIATQTESALICKEYSSIHCISNSGVPGSTGNAFSDGQALKVHTYRASCKQTTTVQSSGHGKTRYRSSSRLCRVSTDFSRCLPPVSSGLHTCHTAAFLHLPNDSTSGFRSNPDHDRLVAIVALVRISPSCKKATTELEWRSAKEPKALAFKNQPIRAKLLLLVASPVVVDLEVSFGTGFSGACDGRNQEQGCRQ
ncbi:hypothetical protein TNCV_1275191 [Trichonephila clavipes]|nr:hypothetical protein TNCV_1275191 [Trichonephila clavipes]